MQENLPAGSAFQKIRHIIFDLGGVILNLDYSKTEQAFAALGVQDFAKRCSQLQQDSVFDALETGRLSEEDFVAAMRKASGNEALTREEIFNAWNSLLLDIPLRRLQILQQLRNQYDLFLLSNTNSIHEAAFHKALMAEYGIPHLGHLFDRVYFSHRVGMRKPDKEIFIHILDENGLPPEHTLFIDDSPQHITTAKSLNIQTIHLSKGMTIEKDVFLPRK